MTALSYGDLVAIFTGSTSIQTGVLVGRYRDVVTGSTFYTVRSRSGRTWHGPFVSRVATAADLARRWADNDNDNDNEGAQ